MRVNILFIEGNKWPILIADFIQCFQMLISSRANNYPNQFRIRVGSVNATAGGILHNVASIIAHPNYDPWNLGHNIGILRVSTIIAFNVNVRPAPIAGSNYHLADYQYVWAIGWGRTTVSTYVLIL